MRGRVCRSQMLLGLASAVMLVSESRGTQYHILFSQIKDSPEPGGPGSRICIPQEQGGPVIPLLGYGEGIRTRLQPGEPLTNSTSLYSLDMDRTKTQFTSAVLLHACLLRQLSDGY
jgi:hypothetical protein